jgi:hypothetical protein
MKERLEKAAMIILQNSTYGTMGKGCDEELKQETLEEAVNAFKKTDVYINEIKQKQERMYSEEEVLEILCKSHNAEDTSIVSNRLKKWFEQFKNKRQ